MVARLDSSGNTNIAHLMVNRSLSFLLWLEREVVKVRCIRPPMVSLGGHDASDDTHCMAAGSAAGITEPIQNSKCHTGAEGSLSLVPGRCWLLKHGNETMLPSSSISTMM